MGLFLHRKCLFQRRLFIIITIIIIIITIIIIIIMNMEQVINNYEENCKNNVIRFAPRTTILYWKRRRNFKIKKYLYNNSAQLQVFLSVALSYSQIPGKERLNKCNNWDFRVKIKGEKNH